MLGCAVTDFARRLSKTRFSVLAIVAIPGGKSSCCMITADLGMLGQPVFAHPADRTFLALPIPARAELPSRLACGLEQRWHDFINWLATAEQGGADGDLGGVDSGLSRALVPHFGEPLFDINRRLEPEPLRDS